MANKRKPYSYQQEIQQMMFVYGEVADPLDTTSCLVEDIVRNQLDQIIKLSTQQSSRRGNRYLAAEDLIFAMRHDRDKTSRLRTFLSWKDVRRNAKDDKIEKVDQLVEDDIDTNVQEKTRKKARVKFTWDSLYTMANILSDDEDEEEDEEEKAAYLDQADRLLAADTMTQSMSKDEYIYYSECRQASFTYKKSKKFREFVDMSKYMETRANSDVIDVLGFLACEVVSKITETALAIKNQWDNKYRSEQHKLTASAATFSGYLFQKPDDIRTPLRPEHIREAFRSLQKPQGVQIMGKRKHLYRAILL